MNFFSRIRPILLLLALQCLVFSTKADSIDSLRTELKGTTTDTGRIRILCFIAREYSKISQLEIAKAYVDSAKQVNEGIRDLPSEAMVNYYEGLLMMQQRYYSKSAESFLKANEIYRELQDTLGTAECYLQHGVLLYLQRKYADALESFRLAEPLYKAVGNTARGAVNQYLTGMMLTELGQYDSAMKNLNEALTAQQEWGDEWREMECRMAIARVNYLTGNYDEALKYYRFAEDYYSTHDSQEARYQCYSGIGDVMLAMGKKAEAEASFLRAFEISKQLNQDWRSLMITERLYRFYENEGDLKKALEFFKMYVRDKDSLFNQENVRSSSELKYYQDLSKAQNENYELKQRELLSEQSDLVQKKVRLILLTVTAVLLTWLIALLVRIRYRRKANRALAAKNKELDDALHHLKATEQQLIKAEKMAVFGRLTAGVAHEIRNPLNFITNFSELSAQVADDFIHADEEADKKTLADQLKKLVDKIGYHGRRADSIVTRMLQHSRTAHTDLEVTDINRLCEEFSDLAYQSMRNLITNFECRLDKQLDPALPRIRTVPQDISQVVINLLNNAFYTVHEKRHLRIEGYEPKVTIATHKNERHALITISDNGKGIPPDVREKIFEPFFTTKPIGEGTGLGLSICSDIIKAAGGTIELDSTSSEGTSIVVSLPLEGP